MIFAPVVCQIWPRSLFLIPGSNVVKKWFLSVDISYGRKGYGSDISRRG